MFAAEGHAVSYYSYIGQQSPNCAGQFPTLIVDNNFIIGQTARVAAVAPTRGQQGLTQQVYIVGGPASGPNSILYGAGYPLMPGLTAYLVLGSQTNIFPMVTTNGVAIKEIPVPNNASLVGQEFIFQALTVDSSCPPGQQFAMSSAVKVKLRDIGYGQAGTIPTSMVSSFTHNGVTFNFAAPVPSGTYVNGERFVVAGENGVRLTSYTPTPTGLNDFGNQYIYIQDATGGTFRLKYGNSPWSSPIHLYGTSALIDPETTLALSSIGLTVSEFNSDNVDVNYISIRSFRNLRVAATNNPVTSFLQVDESGLTRWQYAHQGNLAQVCRKYNNAAGINLKDGGSSAAMPDYRVYISGHPGGTTLGSTCGYPESKNTAIALMQNGFLDLFPGQSLKVGVSITSPAVITVNTSTLSNYGILHVVARAPDVGTIAPPAEGDIKFEVNANDIQYSAFQNLTIPASAPALDLNTYLQKVRWAMNTPYYSVGYAYRQMAVCPTGASECFQYGGMFMSGLGYGLLQLQMNHPLSTKQQIAQLLTGWAVNWFGQNLTFSGSRDANGGQQSGDSLAPFVGRWLGFLPMKFAIMGSGRLPGEQDQVTTITQSIINNSGLGYTQNMLGMSDWKMNEQADPHNSWALPAIIYELNYKFCCTARYWHAAALSARMMGITHLFKYDGWFRYLDRYLTPVNPNTEWYYDNDTTHAIYDAYASTFPSP